MSTMTTETFWGWGRIGGEPWSQLTEGQSRGAAMEALLDVADWRQAVVLPAGEVPKKDTPGQVTRGLARTGPGRLTP